MSKSKTNNIQNIKNNPLTNKSYKADVYKIKLEIDPYNETNFYLDISNVISWDNITLSLTKTELSCLGDFIKDFLEENK